VHEVVVENDREGWDPDVLGAEQRHHMPAGSSEIRHSPNHRVDGISRDIQTQVDV
jgi:hypothetical protein